MTHSQQCTLSATVMAHVSRAASAQKIAMDLGNVKIVMDDPASKPQNPLRTSILAWQAAPEDTTHHLVAQDDIIVTPQLLQRVKRGIQLFPDAVLAFYAFAHHRNGAAMRLAACAGASWVESIPDTYFPVLAVVLPQRYIRPYVAFASKYSLLWDMDDRALARFIHAERLPAFLSVPSFVNHQDLATIAGTPPQGMLKAVCMPPEGAPAETWHDTLASGFDYCPDLYEGQMQLLVRARNGAEAGWIKGNWARISREQFGLAPTVSAEALEAVRSRHQRLFETLEPEYLAGVWDIGFVLGVLVAQQRVPLKNLGGTPDAAVVSAVRKDAFRTLALGGNRGTYVKPAELRPLGAELAEFIDVGFHSGLGRAG
jgi:hypothetical protein